VSSVAETRALILVDHELEFTVKKARNAFFNPQPCPVRFDQNNKVIRVTGKPVAASLKFFIQVVQKDISQKRR